jgi:hypothetical protein
VFTAGGAVATVSVTQAGVVDDHGGDVATATEWDVTGGPASGTLEVGSDQDWYKFIAPTSGRYVFTSDGTGNPDGYLYNQAGSRVAYNLDSGPGLNFQVTATLTAGQTYYLMIRNSVQTNTNTDTGPYTITATLP